jgi:L-fuconate dehydratase
VSKIIAFETSGVRFPTSRSLDGSDAMNPDCSAAYLRVRTDAEDGHEGHAFVFTIGRGNDVEVAAIQSLAAWFIGRGPTGIADSLRDRSARDDRVFSPERASHKEKCG